jgi:RNA polymerase sigma-70 factor, ECF subfamily
VAWDGLTNAEIAVVLGCPRVVVGVRLHRARQRFRGALAAIDTDADCTTHRNYHASRTRPAVSVTMEDQ